MYYLILQPGITFYVVPLQMIQAHCCYVYSRKGHNTQLLCWFYPCKQMFIATCPGYSGFFVGRHMERALLRKIEFVRFQRKQQFAAQWVK